MLWLLAALTLAYALLLLLLCAGVPRAGGAETDGQPPVSVVVAARNEERGVGACLERLRAQDYPPDRLEIIVVDDRSDDRTGAIIRDAAAADGRVRYVHIDGTDPGMPPKKNALARGIAVSAGEIILTTDADCLVPPGWVAGMVRHFSGGIGVVGGYSYYPYAGGLLQRLTAVQAQAMELGAAGALGLGIPATASGRSFGYRRCAYDEAGGFAAVARSVSGDDDLFMHHVVRATRWKAAYAVEPDVQVESVAPDTAGAYSNQRIRHVSAARYYPVPLLALFAGIYAYFLLLTAGTAAAAAGMLPAGPVAVVLLAKFSAELGAYAWAGRLFRRTFGIGLTPLFSVLFTLYVLIYSVWGLVGSFEWKGSRA